MLGPGEGEPGLHLSLIEFSLTYLKGLLHLLTPWSVEEAGALTFEAVPRPSVLTVDNWNTILTAIPREAIGAKADPP